MPEPDRRVNSAVDTPFSEPRLRHIMWTKASVRRATLALVLIA